MASLTQLENSPCEIHRTTRPCTAKDWVPVNYGGYRVVHVYADEISDELRWTHRGCEPLPL